MIDWNGNGRIDPVDIGITIAVAQGENENIETGNAHSGAKTANPPKPPFSQLNKLLAVLFRKGK